MLQHDDERAAYSSGHAPEPESCPFSQQQDEQARELESASFSSRDAADVRDPSGVPLPSEVVVVAESYWSQFSQIRADFPEFLRQSQQQYGDLFKLSPVPFVGLTVVSHPDLIHEILVRDADRYRKSATTAKMIGKFLGEGVLLAEGQDHRAQRRLLQPAFTGSQLQAYIPLIQEETQRWLSMLPSDEAIDFQEACKSLTLQIVVRTLFGSLLQSSEQELIRCMETFEEAISGRFKSMPLPDWIPTKKNREQKAAIEQMHSCISELIAERREALSSNDQPKDLLGRLLHLQAFGGTDYPITDVFIEDQLKTFFFAGHETISRVLTWAVAMLDEHPQWATLVKEELQESAPGDLTLPLTEAFLKETMRLYPPAWVFDRANSEETSLAATTIAAGTTLYISPYVVHRDERWFVDAERFMPERFITGSGVDTFPQKAYIPFGGGPRVCIGAAFALVEAKAILQTMYQAIDTERSSSEPLQHHAGATLGVQGGLEIQICPAAGKES